eukprot:gene1382-15786_t
MLLEIPPDAGFAHPLGMQSGRIRASQLSGPNNADKMALTKARLFGQEGWKPDDAYLGSLIMTYVVSGTLPTLQAAPIYFMVTFTRMKKISYFVIQDSQKTPYDYSQSFFLIYNETQWKHYGSTSARVFECFQVFGHPVQSCRHILEPFRAYSIKVIARDYDTLRKPKWRLEFGGFDYLEADHYWSMDKVMFRNGKTKAEIPDERGKHVLETDAIPYSSPVTTSLIYLDDWRSLVAFNTTPTAFYKLSVGSSGCYHDPSSCAKGLSFSFWMHSYPSFGTLISMGDSGGYRGFLFKWRNDGGLVFSVGTATQLWQAVYTVPECQSAGGNCSPDVKWMHISAVWDKTSLRMYIDGRRVATDSGIESIQNAANTLHFKNLFLLRNFRLWDFVLSDEDIKDVYKDNKIDLTITAMDDLGAWKTSAGCTDTKNTGPCEDQSFHADPGEPVGLLESTAFFVDFSTYSDYSCFSQYRLDVTGEGKSEFPYDVAIVMGFTVRVDSGFNYDDLKSFRVRFYPNTGNPPKLKANIYAAYSRNNDGLYQFSCRSKNFRRDIYTAPIAWSTGPWEVGKTYMTPDLKDIVQPFFSAGKNEKDWNWRRFFFIIFEWITTRGNSLRIRTLQQPNFIIQYIDRRPDKYIYADASNAPYPGYPLRYKTNPIIPRMKCLTFWYHMYGTGIGILSVSMRQQKSVLKEIFRLYGDQGNVWKNASVPLVGLSETSFQFQVIFTAIRGPTTAGDISVDTINFHVNSCSLIPVLASPPEYNAVTFDAAMKGLNMPFPVFLVALDNNHLQCYGSHCMQPTRASDAEKKPATDSFGFPLTDSYFNGTVVKMVPRHPIQNGSDFTLSFEVRPESLTESTILWFGYDNITALSVSVLFSGNLSITLQNDLGVLTTFISQSLIKSINTWTYVALVFSQNQRTLSVFMNNTAKDEFYLPSVKSLPYPVDVLIGGESVAPAMNRFIGYISCVQFYDTALETHIISVHKLCPNRHAVAACAGGCAVEGVCDQITGRCLCPLYANKYVHENCSSALESTVYNGTSAYASFDNKRQVQAALGPSFYHPNILVAENDTRLENASYFFTNGPANLALCTASSSRIRLKELESDCIVQRTCPGSFSLTYWVLMPSWQSMLTKDEIMLIDFGILTVKFVENRTGMNSTWRNAHALIANVTLGGETCQWNIGQYQEFYGVWSHHVIYVDATTNTVSVFYNGKSASVEKRDCFAAAASASPAEVYLGGGAPHICFDEVATWREILSNKSAKVLFEAIAFSGYNPLPPRGINFTELTFNDETGSLWAVDVNNEVYFYHPDQYWMKIEGKMVKVSAGLNGVWAVGEDGFIRFRSGIDDNNPAGRNWTLVPQSSYGLKKLRTICSGFKPGLSFFIKRGTFELYCMMVTATGTISSFDSMGSSVAEIVCASFVCCARKINGRTYCFGLKAFVCGSFKYTMIRVPYASQYIATDSTGHFFRIENGTLYSYQPKNEDWTMVQNVESLNAKFLLSVNGRALIITNSGELKMIGTGERIFKIFHSGGLCLTSYKSADRYFLEKDCDLMHFSSDGCMQSLSSGMFLGYLSPSNYYLHKRAECDESIYTKVFTRNRFSTISINGLVVSPEAASSHPSVRRNVMVRGQTSGIKIEIFEFIFKQASPFKMINSFYPKKKTEGTIKGELIYQVKVSFIFRDLEFYDNFRDLTGIEARYAHRKVEAELKQIFAESNFYIKVELGEISSGANIENNCPFKDSKCFKSLEVKFNGQLYFSYISTHEKNILTSEKFNGEYTDCQDNECTFQLDKNQRDHLIMPGTVELIKITKYSVLLKYNPHKLHTAHYGYWISYTGQDQLERNKVFLRSFLLRDGYVFNVSSLQPNVNYTFTVTPLEIQRNGSQPISIVAATLEAAPSRAPYVFLHLLGKTSCHLIVNTLPLAAWNGVLQGFYIYYAPMERITVKQRWTFNEREVSGFKRITFKIARSFYFDSNILQTFTHNVFYVAGFTNAGTGPFARVECHTLEGAPVQTPMNFSMAFINSTHVQADWTPLMDDFRIWKTNRTDTRGYVVRMNEISNPKRLKTEQNINVTGQNQSHVVIGPLEPNREYSFKVAASNNAGSSVDSNTICLKMDEGVPNAGIKTLDGYSNTSSTLHLILGGMDIENENARILYYNISYSTSLTTEISTVFASAFMPFYNASSLAPINDTQSNSRGGFCSSSAQFLSCRNETSFLQPTANIINFTVTGLQYWTYYTIRASACSCKGCGPYNDSVYIRTDEHKPTCSSERISSSSMASTALNFSWAPLRSNCTHGYFAGYRLYFANASALSELFNLSNSFPLYNATLQQSKFFIETVQAKWSVEGLKKYTNYCIAISGSTVKGFGPLSHAHCATTLQDRPEGPPMNVSVELTYGNEVKISMRPPEKKQRNGIIIGYYVYFSWKTIDNSWSNESVTKISRNDDKDGFTSASLRDLVYSTTYKFEAIAYTSAGEAERLGKFYSIVTGEAPPSAAPRNFTAINISANAVLLRWMQVEANSMHGKFRRFKMAINETLATIIAGVFREIYVYANSTALSETIASYNISNYLIDELTNVEHNNITELYHLLLFGLKAYSQYTIKLASCNDAGCGVSTAVHLRTRETSPAVSPKISFVANSTLSTELVIKWLEIPVLERNGVITGYVLRLMKLCHFLKQLNNTNTSFDCSRILYDNSTDFNIEFVPSQLLQATIGNLSSYTHYLIRIAAMTSAGTGPESEVIVLTAEDVPSIAPVVTAAFNTSGKSIKLEWINIPLPFQKGILLGYNVRYIRTNASSDVIADSINCTDISQNVTQCEVTGLDLHAYYNFSIRGYTIEGLGATTQDIVVRTGPYAHGGWTEWLSWSSCSKSCGGGLRTRRRECTNPSPWNGGDDCMGHNGSSETCNTRLCSGLFLASPGEDCLNHCPNRRLVCVRQINLKNSPAKFEQLGKQCKDKTSQATWKQPFHPAFIENDNICAGFKYIPALISCNATPLSDGKTRRLCNCQDLDDVGFSSWASWSYCSNSCGGGKQTSRRDCLLPQGGCKGDNWQTRDCNTTPCPVNGNWGQWLTFSTCNKTCGYGFQHRHRRCDNPAPSNGGEDCYGQSVEEMEGCNPHLCPTNGGWSSWEGTGICNQACGGGQLVQRRYCDNPRPEFGGEYCQGSPNKTEPCNTHKCKGLQILFWFRFTDFEWNFRYHSLTSPISTDLSAKIQKNVLAAYNYASFVSGIRVLSFRREFPSKRTRREISKEFVVGNIAVFYSQVAQREVLYLQDYVKTNNRVFGLNVTASAVDALNVLPSPPQNLTATPLDPHSINVCWESLVNVSTISNVTTYFLFYREKDSDVGVWEVRGIPIAAKCFNITHLKPVTWYKVRMTISVSYGNGPASKELLVQTIEGAPSIPPKNLKLRPIKPTQIYVEWDPIQTYYFHGYPRGYIVYYKIYQESSYHQAKVSYGASDVILKDLKPFQIYLVIVRAYTSVGVGPGVSNTTKTPEGVPTAPPPNVRVREKYSLDSITVTWNEIAAEKSNGRLKGYKVKYTITKVSNVDVLVTSSSTKEIILDKYTFRLKITGLTSYTTYVVSVCGFTDAGNGPYSDPVIAETCKCPSKIFVNWHEKSPYLLKSPSRKISGIFKEIADKMIRKSCGTCNGVSPNVNYYISPSGESPEKSSEAKCLAKLGLGYHITFPVFGRAEIRNFMDHHIFVLLVQSGGSAMIVSGAIDYAAKTLNALKSVQSTWPMVLISILMCIVFGILLWSVEQFQNEEFAKGRYICGMCQGLWWAFVSMTTVGYGDVTPRTFLGRLIGIIWTLIGLVLTGILTGALTSTITTLTIPPTVTLYDTNAAVINNSFEHGLAVRRNAKILPNMKYDTAAEVLSALDKKQVDAALLDAFETASHTPTINRLNLKVKKVIPGNAGFGFVLSKELVRLESDFRSSISSEQARVTEFVANMTKKLELSNEKPPNIQLFDPKTPAFWFVLNFELYFLGLLTFLGISWTVLRQLRKRRKVAPPADYMRIFADISECSLEELRDSLHEKARTLTLKHQRERLELMELKRNMKRHSKRSAKSNLWF